MSRRGTAWAWLLVAGVAEIGFAAALRASTQSQDAGGAVLVLAVVSFECLAQALKSLPLSLCYAVWTGIGALGAGAVGIIAYGESASPLRIALMLGLIAALVALKLSMGTSHAPADSEAS